MDDQTIAEAIEQATDEGDWETAVELAETLEELEEQI